MNTGQFYRYVRKQTDLTPFSIIDFNILFNRISYTPVPVIFKCNTLFFYIMKDF